MTNRYAIRLTKAAEKELYGLQLKQFRQIVRKIFALQTEPRPQDCKELKGNPGIYRVDQGEYRILYTIEEDAVEVFRVGKRNDDGVYKNL
jgi:mRNA interferase RelE/StbE